MSDHASATRYSTCQVGGRPRDGVSNFPGKRRDDVRAGQKTTVSDDEALGRPTLRGPPAGAQPGERAQVPVQEAVEPAGQEEDRRVHLRE